MAKKFQVTGPYHFEHLINDFDPDFSGAYIWGFMAEKSSKKPIDFSSDNYSKGFGELIFEPRTMQFIPYYVGRAVTVRARLMEHYMVRKEHANKYVRFSMPFLSEFYKWLPHRKSMKGGFVNYFDGLAKKGDITYHNNPLIFNSIKSVKKIKSGASTMITSNFKPHGGKIPHSHDTLKTLNFDYRNFWCVYLKMPRTDFWDQDSKRIERTLYLGLKGGTISEYEGNEADVASISDMSRTNIFFLNNGLISPAQGLKDAKNLDIHNLTSLGRVGY
jgi:hypothetical protein